MWPVSFGIWRESVVMVAGTDQSWIGIRNT